MADLEKNLAGITLAPYIFKAMALIGVRGKAGGNMFRHQMATLGILLDYKIIDPVLLKAAVIHDLFEDAEGLPGVSRNAISSIDADGPAVYDLVMEVTMRRVDGAWEPKPDYLTRVMQSGSAKARVLKLADRISNLFNLGFVNDRAFVRRYLRETKEYILPHAGAVNADMYTELCDLIADREKKLEERLPPASD